MSKSMGKVWKAEPHTIAKIEMLEKYLYVWFSMLGRTFVAKDLWYIDGFAGPGEYTNFDHGSPIAAIRAAQSALERTNDWKAGRIRLVFIEEDRRRCLNLQEVVRREPTSTRIDVQVLNLSFEEGMSLLRTQPGGPLKTADPLFAFIDPFGTGGIPFELVSELLAKSSREVLINFDSDGATRVLKAGVDANHEVHLTSLFGTNSWVTQLLPSLSSAQLALEAVGLYVNRMATLSKVKFVFRFAMLSKSGLANYHLVFASQHPKGLTKMKEVMRAFDQTGQYSFCDAHVGQHPFKFDDHIGHADQLASEFAGQSVGLEAIETFILNKTPLISCKSTLALLERSGRISVKSSNAKRRRGAFPEAENLTIEFLGLL